MKGQQIKENKRSLFVGASNAGTTFLARYASKVLANDGKKVALIDAARDRGIFHSMCIGENEQNVRALSELSEGRNNALAFGNIDIFTESMTGKEIDFRLVSQRLDELASGYDAIIIDADYESALEFIPYGKLFLVQDYKISTALQNQRRFLIPYVEKYGEGHFANTTIIYNKTVPCKVKLSQLEPYMMFSRSEGRLVKLLVDSKADELEIMFEQGNYIADLNNQADGILETKRFTPDLKKGLYDICQKIISLENNLKKII